MPFSVPSFFMEAYLHPIDWADILMAKEVLKQNLLTTAGAQESDILLFDGEYQCDMDRGRRGADGDQRVSAAWAGGIPRRI